MRGGKLDQLIDIQTYSAMESDSGEPVPVWIDLSLRRPASVRPVQQISERAERFAQSIIIAIQHVEFITRWSQLVGDLTPKDRVIYPARDALDEEVEETRLYDIMEVNQIGRREGLSIICRRHPDQ